MERKIITFNYLKDTFSKHPDFIWNEFCEVFSLPKEDAIARLSMRENEFRKLGGPDEGNPWIDLQRAVTKMSAIEFKRVNEECIKYLSAQLAIK